MAKPVSNWALTQESTPAVVVQAAAVQDVVQAVKSEACPTPLLAVGSVHSVTEIVCNQGGTIVSVAGMNKIMGVEGEVVRVQTGVKLADLHDWLAEQDLEITFSPEIGDATVGSLIVSTSKDSCLDGPGYLSACVQEVTYVDQHGDLVTLNSQTQRKEFLAFSGSYGAMGIVVEATLVVRKRVLCRTNMYTLPCKNGKEAAQKLRKIKAQNETMFVIMNPALNYIYVETRNKAKASEKWPLMLNKVAKAIAIKKKYDCFLNGAPPSRQEALVLRANRILPIIHYRNLFVNRYPAIESKSQRRLDFSFFEFDFDSKFDQAVEGCWEVARSHKASKGYMPEGFAMYFTTRPGDKPHGSFSGPAGTSFMLDPITGDCENPQWLAFCREYNDWALGLGANVSLSQTKVLRPGQAALPAEVTRERFLTPFLKQFVVGTAQAA